MSVRGVSGAGMGRVAVDASGSHTDRLLHFEISVGSDKEAQVECRVVKSRFSQERRRFIRCRQPCQLFDSKGGLNGKGDEKGCPEVVAVGQPVDHATGLSSMLDRRLSSRCGGALMRVVCDCGSVCTCVLLRGGGGALSLYRLHDGPGRVQGSVRYRLAHAFSLPSDIGTQVQGRAKGGGRSGKGKGRKGATATQDSNTALQGHSTGPVDWSIGDGPCVLRLDSVSGTVHCYHLPQGGTGVEERVVEPEGQGGAWQWMGRSTALSLSGPPDQSCYLLRGGPSCPTLPPSSPSSPSPAAASPSSSSSMGPTMGPWSWRPLSLPLRHPSPHPPAAPPSLPLPPSVLSTAVLLLESPLPCPTPTTYVLRGEGEGWRLGMFQQGAEVASISLDHIQHGLVPTHLCCLACPSVAPSPPQTDPEVLDILVLLTQGPTQAHAHVYHRLASLPTLVLVHSLPLPSSSPLDKSTKSPTPPQSKKKRPTPSEDGPGLSLLVGDFLGTGAGEQVVVIQGLEVVMLTDGVEAVWVREGQGGLTKKALGTQVEAGRGQEAIAGEADPVQMAMGGFLQTRLHGEEERHRCLRQEAAHRLALLDHTTQVLSHMSAPASLPRVSSSPSLPPAFHDAMLPALPPAALQPPSNPPHPDTTQVVWPLSCCHVEVLGPTSAPPPLSLQPTTEVLLRLTLTLHDGFILKGVSVGAVGPRVSCSSSLLPQATHTDTAHLTASITVPTDAADPWSRTASVGLCVLWAHASHQDKSTNDVVSIGSHQDKSTSDVVSIGSGCQSIGTLALHPDTPTFHSSTSQPPEAHKAHAPPASGKEKAVKASSSTPTSTASSSATSSAKEEALRALHGHRLALLLFPPSLPSPTQAPLPTPFTTAHSSLSYSLPTADGWSPLNTAPLPPYSSIPIRCELSSPSPPSLCTALDALLRQLSPASTNGRANRDAAGTIGWRVVPDLLSALSQGPSAPTKPDEEGGEVDTTMVSLLDALRRLQLLMTHQRVAADMRPNSSVPEGGGGGRGLWLRTQAGLEEFMVGLQEWAKAAGEVEA